MGRISRGLEALSARLKQNVETRQRRPRFSIRSGDLEVVDPGENIYDYWQTVENTPIVRTSLLNFAYDVTEPGLKLDGPDRAINYLEDEWIPQAGIVAGERHKPFEPLLAQSVVQRWGRGGMMVEHVRDDPEDANSTITGVNPIRPETGKFVTLPNKQILVEPSDIEDGLVDAQTVHETKRGEPAAFIQWHPDALRPHKDRETVPLSANDFTRSVFDPGLGTEQLDGVWGNPITETIDDDVAGLKNILRSTEKVVLTKGGGLWDVSFGHETLEWEDEEGKHAEIFMWSKESQDEYVEEMEDPDPGAMMFHDGAIELDNLASEVPDVIPHLEFYVSNITSALPTPLFVVGFEEGINQFVTERQDKRYQLFINRERKELGEFVTQLFRTVVETNLGIDATDLTARVEPPEEASPILSLTVEELEKGVLYTEMLQNVAGNRDPYELIDDDPLFEQILMLDPETQRDIDEDVVSAEDEEVQEQIAELREAIQGDGGEEGQPPQDPPQQPPQPPTEADD
ncbi:hypothetical protein [Natronorarus salvus]|uniref:hypothetical protein n=1 Tax=Natronorarus salvus TaxID=3117733 RepID=UPI002F26A911